ncbi:gfo/Idh/MocA family oxidoreductase, partial [Streptomyces sp. SID6041]|nr:gfo/Idh/MocA family oxidoreductase [Streptomyces sp. SID6041]
MDMLERFIRANQALLDAMAEGTYGRLEQLTLWNKTAALWPGASAQAEGSVAGGHAQRHGHHHPYLCRPTDVTVTTVARDEEVVAVEAA